MIDFVLFIGSGVLIGFALSFMIENLTNLILKRKETSNNFNTISHDHIMECIGLQPDNCRSINSAVKNIKNEKVDFNFQIQWD